MESEICQLYGMNPMNFVDSVTSEMSFWNFYELRLLHLEDFDLSPGFSCLYLQPCLQEPRVAYSKQTQITSPIGTSRALSWTLADT